MFDAALSPPRHRCASQSALSRSQAWLTRAAQYPPCDPVMAGVGERTASDEGKESVSLLRADSGSTAPPKRQHGWREVVITVGAALIALLSNTPTAFNAISGQFKDDVGASITPLFLSVFLGAGVAGLQFTLLAGLLIDRAGAVVGTGEPRPPTPRPIGPYLGFKGVISSYVAAAEC